MAAASQAGDPGLRVAVGGQSVAPVLAAAGWLGFALPPAPGEARLLAPTFRPAELGLSGDRRTLGFAVTGIEVVALGGRRHFAPGSARFGAGFHRVERDGWQWTEGEAVLPADMFAGLDGPALLVVRGFGRHGGAFAASHHGAFLCGDSWPADEAVERHVRRVLAPFLAGTLTGQAEMLAPGEEARQERDLAARERRLASALAGRKGRVVLFGRSSGARVATLHAARAQVDAVVCLGYPFLAQGRVYAPERHAHLATAATPTLIVQGREDGYGTAADLRGIALSPQVTIHPIDGGHEFRLAEAGWQALGRRILLFLAGLG